MPPLRIVIQLLGRPYSPRSWFAIHIDQIVAMVQDVVGDALASGPNLSLLLLVSRQLGEQIPTEVMAVEFVGGSLPFPEPTVLDGRFVPFAIRADRAARKLRFLRAANGPRRKAAQTRKALQSQQCFHRPPCLVVGWR